MKLKLKKFVETNSLMLFTISIIILLIETTQASKITPLTQKGCTYTFNDNTSVDLLPLRRDKDYTFPVGRYIYKGNFCGTQHDKCSGLEIPAPIYIRRN